MPLKHPPCVAGGKRRLAIELNDCSHLGLMNERRLNAVEVSPGEVGEILRLRRVVRYRKRDTTAGSSEPALARVAL
ncbi:MAG TPA: hypothetical protein VJZ26_18285 [Blastocatellia bacterium]|nr:hypothetical protein [Blastocatellia bacterium]